MRDTDPPSPSGPALQLLQWYDRHARVMPWRVGPQARASGQRPDPYRVWLSEVMLQQTTVAAVTGYFQKFTALWPDVAALAAAPDEQVMAEWAGLGYYARARNLLKCARAVVARGGFPDTVEGLLTLPGIGPYTAGAVAAIAFDRPAVVVDGNVERVMARMFREETPLPAARPRLTALAASLTPTDRPGDYAQAVMDLGATICTPRSPACGICPWSAPCAARAAGIQAELPRRLPKSPKPQRHGRVWILRGPQGWLIERRPEKGLLGGMIGWPGDAWDSAGGPAPAAAEWQDLGQIRHVFTHFELHLQVFMAIGTANPLRGEFLPDHLFDPAALPTVMRKAHALAAKALSLR